MRIITDERCTAYRKPGHPDQPARVWATQRLLREHTELCWVEAADATDEALLRGHTARHLERLAVPADFDPNTPWYPGLPGLAGRAAGAALQAVASARSGVPALSLMRPPGHHALPERAMGFCYLSNAALAALSARAGGCDRVAVLDFDVHHGNGTEELLVDREGLLFASVHRSPGFPHTGRVHRGHNCRNHPVPPRAPRPVYRDALSRALDDVARFDPELLVVSAGFDAHRADPIGQELLEVDDFGWLGERVAALGVPACHLLEGGYGPDLPELVLAYVLGLL